MLWLGVYLPAFGLEVARRQAGIHQDQQPEVLVHDQTVIACNEAAHTAGIHPGTTLATAQSLVPDTLRHLPQNRQHEAARLALVAEVLYRFSADVSLESPDAIVLEAGRSLRLFGNIRSLATQVADTCSELGHIARVRAAATPLAALALARSQAETLPQVPLVHLTLPPKHVERLANMGLSTLGQVMALPRRELAQRFGRDFADHLLRLVGDLPDPRTCIRPRSQFAEALHLLEPVRDKATLQLPMTRLLESLNQWLISHQLGAEAIIWSFAAHAASSRVEMPVRVARAQQDARAFSGISQLKLASTELPEDVLSIGLDARRLRPWLGQASSLFPELADAGGNGDPAECTALLDQLGARLGDQACMRLQTIDSHTPELAWRPVQVASRPRLSRQPPVRPGKRPLWIFTPPRPVAVADLTLLEGPERIQSHWWGEQSGNRHAPGSAGDVTGHITDQVTNQTTVPLPARAQAADETAAAPARTAPDKPTATGPVQRDYYTAVHRNGARCWVFVDQAHQWYLHGYFA